MRTFADLCTGCVFICISLTAVCPAAEASPASAPAGKTSWRDQTPVTVTFGSRPAPATMPAR